MVKEDSARLLELAKNGDAEAMEALLKEFQPRIYRFGMKMCRHPEDAEDVLQDTMLTLARSVRDFRGESSLSTWLYTVTRSFCMKKRRKSKFAPKVEESLEGLSPSAAGALESTEPGPDVKAESNQAWGQVQKAIAGMEPEFREVLMLRDVEGLKAKEVAEIIGVSVAAVKSRLHRARAQLRSELVSPVVIPSGCPDIRAVFSRHLEGDLSSGVCATMEAHVADCAFCAAECDGLKATLNICSTSQCEAVPEGIQRRVQSALRAALARPPR